MVNKAREDREQLRNEIMDYLGLVPQLAAFDGRDKALSPEEIKGLDEIIARHCTSGGGDVMKTKEMSHCTAESAPRKCPTCGHEKAETCSICDHFTFEGKCHLSACRCESCGRTALAESALDSAPPTQPPQEGGRCPLCGSTDERVFLGKCADYHRKNEPAHIFHWPSTSDANRARMVGLSEAAPEKE